jgi:hypothetical protein
MFDEAPANLPVEPTSGPAPKPPLDMNNVARPAASVPRPAPAPMPAAPMPAAPAPAPRPAAAAPRKQEPEDIFGDLEKSGPTSADHSEGLPSAHHGGGKGIKVALIVVGAIAAVGVLGIGGWMLYNQFIASPTTPPPAPVEQAPVNSVPELPPAVEPTPTPVEPTPTPVEPLPTPTLPPPDGIPQPNPVTPTPSGAVDTDGDGVTDADEQSMGTDPTVADSDGDGLTDGDEVARGSDPKNTDTDADGLADGDEVRVWRSNPAVADTDGDGYPDGAEVQNNYNPSGPGKLPS